jgi:hypothetical protein
VVERPYTTYCGSMRKNMKNRLLKRPYSTTLFHEQFGPEKAGSGAGFFIHE